MDVFAAGIVLWEALTGRALFRRKDDVATINAVLREKVVPPSSIVPALPQGLDAIVLKALERHPDDRFETAEDFGNALEQLNIDRVTQKVVSAYVDATLGPELAQRREAIRVASEEVQHGASFAPMNSDVHPKLVIGPTGEVVDKADAEVTAILSAPVPEVTEDMATQVAAEPLKYWSQPPSLPPGEIEHRRMRGLLAAAMLLLVGGAVGLLLARSNAGVAPAPAPSHVSAPGSASP